MKNPDDVLFTVKILHDVLKETMDRHHDLQLYHCLAKDILEANNDAPELLANFQVNYCFTCLSRSFSKKYRVIHL